MEFEQLPYIHLHVRQINDLLYELNKADQHNIINRRGIR